MGLTSGATMDLSSGAQLGIGAGGLVNIDGTLVNVGNGTTGITATASGGSVTASLVPQVLQKGVQAIPNICVAEIAKVVKPQEITNVVTPTLPSRIKRFFSGLSGLMRTDDDE
jgi:hypothetical protein